jgi:thiol-disulfide isomerase/thioredoxin
MKNIFFLLVFLLLVCFSGCGTTKPAVEIPPATENSNVTAPSVNFSEQSTWLLGYFNQGRLTSPPYSEWYIKGYNEYQVNQEAMNKLTEISKDDLTIKIVLGTWCPDSRREVPRFMKVLELWKFPVEKVTFIGVDNAKLSPIGEYDKLEIQLVPTFIIMKNNVEAGRIIENPVTSLEQDMLNILTRNEK